MSKEVTGQEEKETSGNYMWQFHHLGPIPATQITSVFRFEGKHQTRAGAEARLEIERAKLGNDKETK